MSNVPHPVANILIGDDWEDVVTLEQIKASCGLKGAQVSQMRTYSKAVPGEWLK